MACIYQSMLGCSTCDHPLYRTCSKFVKARSAYLVRALQPLKFSRQSFRGSVVWSSDINKAKSAAAQVAIRRNNEVRKLTLSQVLSLILDGSDLAFDCVYFIDGSAKLHGDTEKILSVVTTFLSKVETNNGFVSVYLNPTTNCRLVDYPRL